MEEHNRTDVNAFQETISDKGSSKQPCSGECEETADDVRTDTDIIALRIGTLIAILIAQCKCKK